jgi:hypothetical protein
MLAAMGPYRTIAEKALATCGVGTMVPDGWYSLDAFLGAFDALGETVGPNTLFATGKKVPDHAVLPPDIRGVEAALASIDVAYHLNHRREGQVMFDLTTGEMLEGIGHYRCHPDGDRRIVMVCENPYPPEFDRGVVTGFARRFEPTAKIERDPSKPTRLQGADSCTFIVTW